jgi:hypothetical protein
MNRTAAAASARHSSNSDQAIEAHVPTSSRRPDFNAHAERLISEGRACAPQLYSQSDVHQQNLLKLALKSDKECQAALSQLLTLIDVKPLASQIDLAALAAICAEPPKIELELNPVNFVVLNDSRAASTLNQQVEDDSQACCNGCTLM